MAEFADDQLSVPAMENELGNISRWWMTHGYDAVGKCFHGKVANDGTAAPDAAKGAVHNARILWFFSEAALKTGDADCRRMADEAYHYLTRHFVDHEHGGLITSVNSDGSAALSRKLTYAQAFGIYGLSAYHQLTGSEPALSAAMELFQVMEKRCSDPKFGGYFEAFARDWSPLDDMRLSEVDANFPKSMNNHLHIIEAYTALYLASQDRDVGKALKAILNIFSEHIVQPGSHLGLYFSEDWTLRSRTVSYGHDIEASWLMHKAASALNDPATTALYAEIVREMATVCHSEGVSDGGFVINERHEDGTFDLTSIWWVQAEALVGFLNAFILFGDQEYFRTAERIWLHIQAEHIDRKDGEWTWFAAVDGAQRDQAYKSGMWKGPYHNGRAMIEAAKMLQAAAAIRTSTEEPLVQGAAQ